MPNSAEVPDNSKISVLPSTAGTASAGATPPAPPPETPATPTAETPAGKPRARQTSLRPQAPLTEEQAADQYELPSSEFDEELDSEIPAKPRAKSPPASEKAPSRDSELSPQRSSEQPEPAAYTHSKRLVRMAQDLGISQADIDGTPTEQLDDIVYHMNRRLLEERARQPHVETPRQQPAPAPEEVDPDLAELEADLDPRLLKVLKKQAKENSDLKKELSTVRQAEQRRTTESLADQIDRTFDTLGDEANFGKGKGRTLDGESVEYQRRMAVLRIVDTLKTGSLEDKMRKAAEILGYGKKKAPPPAAEEEEEDPIEAKLRERRDAWKENGGTARPTKREHKEPKGENRAVKTIAKKMREQGLEVDDNSGTEEAGLPD